MPRPPDAERQAAGPWCLRCGGPGTVLAESIDPNRPLGRCAGCTNPDRPLVLLPLSRLPADRLEAQRADHRRKVTRQHHRHVRGELVSPYCTHCNRLGWSYAPAEPGTPATGTIPAAVQPEGGP